MSRKKPSPSQRNIWNISEAEYLLEATFRLKKELEYVPDPNEDRLEEIKESIRRGDYARDAIIDEVAKKILHIYTRAPEQEREVSD